MNAQIQPQVSGYLIRKDHKEVGLVRKGQVLFEIDPRPFQAALDQAKGQLAQAQAQMANADIGCGALALRSLGYQPGRSLSTEALKLFVPLPFQRLNRPADEPKGNRCIQW